MNAHRAHLAVVAGRGNIEKQAFELNYGLFHGTAFCFAPNLVLTAAHVVHDAQGDGEIAVALLAPGSVDVRLVQNTEIFDDIDLAILVCPGLRAEILPFRFSPPLDFLEDFMCFGFPFGLEPPNYPRWTPKTGHSWTPENRP